MSYAVLTETLCGWDDCWTEELEDGSSHPQRFDTPRDAQAAIDELIEDFPTAAETAFVIVPTNQVPEWLDMPPDILLIHLPA